jgi:hypothetical protein
MTVPENALMLVAILPTPADLEIARVLGWYRIPYRSAPKTVQVDYITFYQPAQFGAEKWQLSYYAAVRGHELVTRAELFRNQPEHPRSQEMYFKLQLGPLAQRIPPIAAQNWRRVTFFYTTGAYFNQANDISDLVVGSAERELLWQCLRERGIASKVDYQAPNDNTPPIDLAIFCALGNLGITIDPTLQQPEETMPASNWTGLHLPQRTVHEKPAMYLDLIAAQVAKLGGLRPST